MTSRQPNDRPELYGSALVEVLAQIIEQQAAGIAHLSERLIMAEAIHGDNPYTRYQRAQTAFDGLERQRDAALMVYIKEPSIANQDAVFEGMGGLRSARRELMAAIISLMYFVVSQDQIGSDEAYGALEQMVRAHERRIAALEGNRERSA